MRKLPHIGPVGIHEVDLVAAVSVGDKGDLAFYV
jgi:hypothetical protein